VPERTLRHFGVILTRLRAASLEAVSLEETG
jgi:hypothetical protein